jgi:hypothetical protein
MRVRGLVRPDVAAICSQTGCIYPAAPDRSLRTTWKQPPDTFPKGFIQHDTRCWRRISLDGCGWAASTSNAAPSASDDLWWYLDLVSASDCVKLKPREPSCPRATCSTCGGCCIQQDLFGVLQPRLVGLHAHKPWCWRHCIQQCLPSTVPMHRIDCQCLELVVGAL